MKRRFAAVMLLFMLCACFSAQAAPIAIYEMPDGAQVSYLLEADFDVPNGMQPAYDLMYNATQRGDIYLVRMKNGYGLASVSCSELKRELSTQDSLDRWPQILQNIALEGVRVDAAASTGASVVNRSKICLENSSMARAQSVEISMPQNITVRRILGTRSYFWAPRFGPTMVLPAVVKELDTMPIIMLILL